jgi:hypothetical protein
LIPLSLKTFLTVLVGSAGVLGIVYLGLDLTFGRVWIDSHAALVFTHGLYWLLIPPIFVAAIPTQKEVAGFHSPKIKKIMDDCLIIVEPCEWLGHRTGVAVFKVQDDVELFMFAAEVINIQSNKLVQLKPIIQDSDPLDAAKLRDIKETLLIKPGRIT